MNTLTPRPGSNRPVEWQTIDALRAQLDNVITSTLERGLEATQIGATKATAIVFLIYREGQHVAVKHDFYEEVMRAKGRSLMAKVLTYLMPELPPHLLPTMAGERQQMIGTLEVLNKEYAPLRDPTAEEVEQYIERRGGLSRIFWDWMTQKNEESRKVKRDAAEREQALAEFESSKARAKLEKEASEAGISVDDLLAKRTKEAEDKERVAREAKLQLVIDALVANGEQITPDKAKDGDILVVHGGKFYRVRGKDRFDLLACKANLA